MVENRYKEDPRVESSTCVLFSADQSRVLWSSTLALAISDGFPVSPGHSLIIPKRHAESWDDLTADEKNALLSGIDAVRALLIEEHAPNAFTVGFNDGRAAGQTLSVVKQMGQI